MKLKMNKLIVDVEIAMDVVEHEQNKNRILKQKKKKLLSLSVL